MMRVGVMAAGAVGGYFGARLVAAGHDVVFFARGAHLEAIRKNGLKVESPLGNLHLKDVQVTDDPSGIAPVDLIFFAVKLWDTERAAAQLRPLVKSDTRVMTLQNGVDSVDRLAPILGDAVVIGGSTYVVTVIAEPGVIRQTSPFARIRCGRLDGKPDSVLANYVEQIRTAGIEIVLSDQMRTELWKKFVLLSGTSGITSSTRQPLGPIRSDPDMRAFFFKLMGEAFAVGKASGVAFPGDYMAELEQAVEAFPPTMKASMAHDLERGNRMELDWLAGTVVKLGRKLNVPTPANEAVFAILKSYRMGRG
jgi:2-dehydropantoate 2-reductase